MPKFPRQSRLLHKKDFQHVFDKPRRLVTKYFTLYYRTNQQQHARLGLAISRKNIARAVQRNRCKRCTRESFRLQSTIKSLPIDIVFVARQYLARADTKTLREELEKAWQQLIDMHKAPA